MGEKFQELISTSTFTIVIKYLTLTGGLPHATHCAKNFTAIISFNSHNNLVELVQLLPSRN